MSQVAPRAVPQGKQAAFTPLKNFVPLTPFGPSDTRIAGMPCFGMATVCHQSEPAPISMRFSMRGHESDLQEGRPFRRL